MDDSQEARRERIRLAKLRRREAERAGLSRPMTPVTPLVPQPRSPSPDVSIVSVSSRRPEAEAAPGSAGGATGSPAARAPKRRREEIFMGILEKVPEERRGPARAFLLQLAEHKRVVKEIKQDVEQQQADLQTTDEDYHTKREFLKRDMWALIEIESRIAERRRYLGSADFDLARFSRESNEEITRNIQAVKDSLGNHAAKIMELQNERQAIAWQARQERNEARRQGLPQHPQSMQAMSRYNQQRREEMERIREQQGQLVGGPLAPQRGMFGLAPLPRRPLPQMATVRTPQRPGQSAAFPGDPEDIVEDELARGIVHGRDFEDDDEGDEFGVSFEEGTAQLLSHAGEDIEPVDLPPQLNVSVLEHQRRGLAWLLKQENSEYKGGVLADDMGLGKTVQTIALMYANPPGPEVAWKDQMTLIVCPLSLMDTWVRELEQRVQPAHRWGVYVHNANFNKGNLNTFHDSGMSRNTKVVVSTYETVASEFRALKKADSRKPTPLFKHKWYRIVLDEAHNIKNPKAQRSEACADLQAQFRLCLSGTPMQNSLIEMWPLLRFLRIRPFWYDIKGFKKLLPAKRKDGQTTSDFESTEEEKMKHLQKLFKGFLLRRTKYTKINGVPILSGLPAKEQFEIHLRMTPEEAVSYARFEAGIKDKARDMLEADSSISNMLVLLLRMRQWALHPSLQKVTSEQWAPCPPKQTPAHVHMARQMDPTAVLTAVDAMGANHSPEVDPKLLRLCVMCGDVMPLEVARVISCGHQLCSSCLKSLPEDSPGQVTGSAKCPVSDCGKMVYGDMVLSLLILVATHVTTSDTQLVAEYMDRRRQMQQLWARQKNERAAALANYLRSFDDETELSFFDSSSDDEEDPLEAESVGVPTVLREEPPVGGDVKGEPSEPSEPSVVKGEGVSNGAPHGEPNGAPNGEPNGEPDQVKGEPEGDTKPPVKDEPSVKGEDDDSKLDSQDTQPSQDPDAEDSQDPDADGEAGICGQMLAKKAEARYKVDINKVASLFHRSNCFEEGWVSSTKVHALIEALHDVWASNPRDKVIVFSFFTSFLDVLTIPLNAARIPFLCYSGQQSAEERNEALRKFRTTSAKVLLISLRTGNAGLTLTEANHVFIMEPFWNPYVEEQAKDRVHRIGQRKQVKIYRFVCLGTVEERIVQLQNEKMELIEAALNNPSITVPKQLSRGDLLFALGLERRAGNRNGGRRRRQR